MKCTFYSSLTDTNLYGTGIDMLNMRVVTRFHQGLYKNDNATFQQYTIVPAEITAKVGLQVRKS